MMSLNGIKVSSIEVERCLTKSLPHTTANKVMRRILQQRYQENHHE